MRRYGEVWCEGGKGMRDQEGRQNQQEVFRLQRVLGSQSPIEAPFSVSFCLSYTHTYHIYQHTPSTIACCSGSSVCPHSPHHLHPPSPSLLLLHLSFSPSLSLFDPAADNDEFASATEDLAEKCAQQSF